MHVKFFKKTATLLAVGACVAGISAPAAAQETKLALRMSGWTGLAPLSLADKVGIFNKTPIPSVVYPRSRAPD